MNRSLMLTVACAAGCTAQELAQTQTSLGMAEKAVAEVLISDAQEAQLGLQLHESLLKGSAETPPIKSATDPEVTGYVEGIVAKLRPYADRDRKSDWKVFVIDDPKTVNAFAAPGAYLYVYTGLLLTADTEAEVVGVLGHEMGHVVARHSARQMVDALGLNAVASLALGENPDTLAKVAASLVGNGTMLAHSRASENEADQFAVKYSFAAGYSAAGIATFFQKLQASQGNTPQLLTWLSTHPAPADRIQTVTETIATLGLGGKGEIGAGRLEPIKARLKPGAPAIAAPAPPPPSPAPATRPATPPPAQPPAKPGSTAPVRGH